jgi:antitoxin component of MazEF toxin-antitoxin module
MPAILASLDGIVQTHAMSKRLQAIGNGKGLIIDQPLLDLLEITQETELDIKTDGKSLIITPIERERRRTGRVAKVQPQARIPQRHAGTFRRVAK